MKRSDPPQLTPSGPDVSKKRGLHPPRRVLFLVALGLGLLAALALVFWLMFSGLVRSSQHSSKGKPQEHGQLRSAEEGEMRPDSAEPGVYPSKSAKENLSLSGQDGSASLDDLAEEEGAGGAPDDEDWSGRIERFDENARRFDERAAIFERELSQGLTDPKRAEGVERFLSARLLELSPDAEARARCTPSICEVHLLGGGSVGALIADVGPLLRELASEATGNSRSDHDGRSSFRLLFQANEAPMGQVDLNPESK